MLKKSLFAPLIKAYPGLSNYPARHCLQPLRPLLSTLLPRHCLFCLQQTPKKIPLCQGCMDELPLNLCHCRRCAIPLEIILSIDKINSLLCGNCLSRHYYYDQVYSPYHYSDGIRYLIRKFKYHQKLYYAPLLSDLFNHGIRQDSSFLLPEALLPIPMHPYRLKQRGYNQAMELTKVLAQHYHLPICHNVLARIRYTSLQAGLAAKQRQTNMLNAFAVKKPIPYNHIALIDDVMTTGSTVNEAARILKKQAGISSVDVWTIARA